MSFGLQLGGFVIVIAGLIYAKAIFHVSTHWIAIGAAITLGILSGVKAARQKNPDGTSQTRLRP